MREIPSLQVLCLRSVGSHSCSAEDTFASKPAGGSKKKNAKGEPSSASRLLRSFHRRPLLRGGGGGGAGVSAGTTSTNELPAVHHIPMYRTPCVGPGSARRVQANEVDLNHPWIGCRMSEDDIDRFVMQRGSPALDCLQSYISSLVELGRMDDTRLGVHFFREWKANVLLAAGLDPDVKSFMVHKAPSKKRARRSRQSSPTPTTGSGSQSKKAAQHNAKLLAAMGSLSLHNCTFSGDTVEAMVKSGMGPHVATLDLTGVHGLSDDLTAQILPGCPNLKRLSLKNCRRITVRSLRLLHTPKQRGTKLTALDIGGAYNISTDDVLQVVPCLPKLKELHASGLGWTDRSVDALLEDAHDRRPWKALSFGFSANLSQSVVRQSLARTASTLVSLAVHFCESVMDNAAMGIMGRNLPSVQYLDVRGNPSLTTLTGWYDGRASADLPAQPLVVLGRYSGLSEASVDETKRIHPLETNHLTVILDGTGTGAGITVVERS